MIELIGLIGLVISATLVGSVAGFALGWFVIGPFIERFFDR